MFSNEELAAIDALISALPPAVRADFLQAVSAKLSAHPPQERGAGLVHRLAVEAQREFVGVAFGRPRTDRRQSYDGSYRDRRTRS